MQNDYTAMLIHSSSKSTTNSVTLGTHTQTHTRMHADTHFHDLTKALSFFPFWLFKLVQTSTLYSQGTFINIYQCSNNH